MARPKITPEDNKRIVDALIETIRSGAKTKTLDAETSVNLDREFTSQIEKYHAEPHYWVTFHHNGEEDKVDTWYIGAAGVQYSGKKGERVLLPQSAINCMKYAVRIGLDHGHPVVINGKKYIKKVQEPLHNYTVEPQVVSPEEAAEWRMRQERLAIQAQDFVPIDGGNPLQDLVEIGE
jgi:hypothetical protein